MGKMLNMIMFVIAIQFAMILFNTGTTNLPQGSLVSCNTTDVYCTFNGTNGTESFNTITNLVLNPSDWARNPFILLIGTIALVGGLILGTFWIKNDFVVMAVLVGSILSFGLPIINLWSVIATEGGDMFGANTITAGLIASMLLFPIILLYVWTVLDWWRGRD